MKINRQNNDRLTILIAILIISATFVFLVPIQTANAEPWYCSWWFGPSNECSPMGATQCCNNQEKQTCESDLTIWYWGCLAWSGCTTCVDGNKCTKDSCSGGNCNFSNVVCDGSTCSVGSSDYCAYCTSCGNGTCESACEDASSCPSDCDTSPTGSSISASYGPSSSKLLGFAWSSNIGWISVNNCDLSGTCSGTDYGVNIDTGNGNLSGYAWSSNIGWINFDPSGPYPDSPPHSVEMDLYTKKVTGWARAHNSTNDDYGWIKFGYGSGGSYMDSSGIFQGWAWGGGPYDKAVIGWISLSGSGYRVRVVNEPPYVADLAVSEPTDREFCLASQGSSPADYELSWRFHDDNDVINDYMRDFEVRITNTSSGDSGIYSLAPYTSNIYPDGSTVTVSNIYAGTSETLTSSKRNQNEPIYLQYDQKYSWEVRVQDSSYETAWSSPWKEAGSDIEIPIKYPLTAFDYTPKEPTVNEEVSFDASDSQAYGPGNSLTSYLWDLGGGSTDNGVTATNTYDAIGEKKVQLDVTDSIGRTCTTTENVSVEPQPEKWEEVIPR